MTMKRPNTRIISLELNSHMSQLRDELRIPPRRILLINDSPIPNTIAYMQDMEIMAVHMEWMCEGSLVRQVQHDRTVLVEIVDVPFRTERVGDVAFCRFEEEGDVEVGAVRYARELPDEMACGVDAEGDF